MGFKGSLSSWRFGHYGTSRGRSNEPLGLQKVRARMQTG